MSRVLVVDNYDSFVFTIVQYLLELGADCAVVGREHTRPQDLGDVDGVLLSPGPGRPEDTGVCRRLVHEAERRSLPLLGVCLGHQVIAIEYGAVVGRASELVHGSTSPIFHNGSGTLNGLPSPFLACRYHSLAVDPGTVPESLEITAWTGDGVVMGLRHRDHQIEGVQFHPESVLSEGGHRLLGNWLAALQSRGRRERPGRPHARPRPLLGGVRR